MENKINRQTKNEEIDRLLEEQYYAETKILESAILKAAGKSSWEEFLEESEYEGGCDGSPGVGGHETTLALFDNHVEAREIASNGTPACEQLIQEAEAFLRNQPFAEH